MHNITLWLMGLRKQLIPGKHHLMAVMNPSGVYVEHSKIASRCSFDVQPSQMSNTLGHIRIH